jgi:hypothetical protein
VPFAGLFDPQPNNRQVASAAALSTYAGDVRFYGVVSAQTEKVVEFFLDPKAAEAMIGEVREDEPALVQELRIEAIELPF